VREVVAKVIAATGSKLEPEELPRRAGDPPKLIGNATRITEVLGWQAQYNLDDIVTSSYTAWQADPKRPHF
jgi:UDP-glucose 4-epimerase